jgi:hypothetical protein
LKACRGSKGRGEVAGVPHEKTAEDAVLFALDAIADGDRDDVEVVEACTGILLDWCS